MDLAILTQDEDKVETQQNTDNYKDEQHEHRKQARGGGDTGASEGQAVPTSGKIPAMLLIYLKVSAAIEERTI